MIAEQQTKKSLWKKALKTSTKSRWLLAVGGGGPARVTNGHVAIVTLDPCAVEVIVGHHLEAFEISEEETARRLPFQVPGATEYRRQPIWIEARGKIDNSLRMLRVYQSSTGDYICFNNDLLLLCDSPEALYTTGLPNLAVDDVEQATVWLMPFRLGPNQPEWSDLVHMVATGGA